MKYVLGFGVLWFFFSWIGIGNDASAIIAALLMFTSVCASVWQNHKEDQITNAEYEKIKSEQRKNKLYLLRCRKQFKDETGNADTT